MVPGYKVSAHVVTLFFYVRKKFTDINVGSLLDIRVSFHVTVTDVITVVMTSLGRHNLIARFDLFCFNTILLRRFSYKNIKKEIRRNRRHK